MTQLFGGPFDGAQLSLPDDLCVERSPMKCGEPIGPLVFDVTDKSDITLPDVIAFRTTEGTYVYEPYDDERMGFVYVYCGKEG